jgi:hypothetical protein
MTYVLRLDADKYLRIVLINIEYIIQCSDQPAYKFIVILLNYY